jgi:hypothetical protein
MPRIETKRTTDIPVLFPTCCSTCGHVLDLQGGCALCASTEKHRNIPSEREAFKRETQQAIAAYAILLALIIAAAYMLVKFVAPAFAN